MHSILESTSSLRSSSRRESENMYTVGEVVAGQEVSSTAAVRRAEIVLPRLVAIAAYCRGMHPTHVIRRGSPLACVGVSARSGESRVDSGSRDLILARAHCRVSCWQCGHHCHIMQNAVLNTLHEFTRTHAKREFQKRRAFESVIKTVCVGESVENPAMNTTACCATSYY